MKDAEAAVTETFLSFDECPPDPDEPGDGDNTLLAGAPWANPFAAPLTDKASRGLRDQLAPVMAARLSAPAPARRIVPHPRDLKPGSVGWDVLALQRALAAAHLRRWGTFTRVYGRGTRKQVEKFQASHGLHADGVYGRDTHRKLAARYDAYGIRLLNHVHVRTPAEARRSRLLSAAMILYNRRYVVHYTQGPARMTIVRHRLNLAQLETCPQFYEDCSSSITGLRYVAGLTDPNGLGFNGYGFCHEPSARILLSDLSWVPAGDVRVGDEIWALDDESPGGTKREAQRRYRRATVIASFLAKKECVRVCLSNGESFVCSDDHPWLTQTVSKSNHRWTRADLLLSGRNERRTLVRPFIPWQRDTSYDAGWLAGMFDGEGWVVNRSARGGRTNGIGVTQTLGATCDRLVELSHKYGSFKARTIERERCKPRIEVTSNGGGMPQAAAFLGTIRPERLIANFNLEGGQVLGRNEAEVVAVERVGVREVQSIQTTAGTYFAEGFAVHNTGTMAEHGIRIASSIAKVGAVYLYGSGYPYGHVTMNVGVDRAFSHGSESGPRLSSVYYRNDLRLCIQYPGLP